MGAMGEMPKLTIKDFLDSFIMLQDEDKDIFFKMLWFKMKLKLNLKWYLYLKRKN